MGSPAPSFSQVQTARSITQRSAASGGASSSGRALNSPRQSSGRGTATPSQRRSLHFPLELSRQAESSSTNIALPESQSQSAGASVRSSSGTLHRPAAHQAAVAKPGARQMAADRSGAQQAGAARSAAQRKQSPGGVQLRHSWAAPQQERHSGFSPSSAVARGLLANQGVRHSTAAGAAAGAASNKVSGGASGLAVQGKGAAHGGYTAGAHNGIDCHVIEPVLYAVVMSVFCGCFAPSARRLKKEQLQKGQQALCHLDLAVPNNMLCPRRRVHQHRSEGASWTHHATMPPQQQTQQQLWTRRWYRQHQRRELASRLLVRAVGVGLGKGTAALQGLQSLQGKPASTCCRYTCRHSSSSSRSCCCSRWKGRGSKVE